jgi:hypothetical protein
MLRVIEEQMPILIQPYAGTGRIPCQYTPFIRSFLAKGYFGIEKTSQLYSFRATLINLTPISVALCICSFHYANTTLK